MNHNKPLMHLDRIWSALWKSWYRPYAQNVDARRHSLIYDIDWDPVSTMDFRFQVQDLYESEADCD